MISVIHGDDLYFVRKKLKELSPKEEWETSRFDGEGEAFDSDMVLSALMSSSLFSSHPTVILRNPPFLFKKPENEKEEKKWIQYFQNPSSDSDLIIYGTVPFKKNLKIYKALSANARFYQFDKMNEYRFKDFAMGIIQDTGLPISREAAQLLIDRCDTDSESLMQAIEKLRNVPEKITYDIVDVLCPQKPMDDVFLLVNAICEKNCAQAFIGLRNYEAGADSYLPFIALLANQFRFMVSCKILKKKGYGNQAIVQELKLNNDYRLRKIEKLLSKFTIQDMMRVLYDLSNLDIAFKSDSSLSMRQRMESFILHEVNHETH